METPTLPSLLELRDDWDGAAALAALRKDGAVCIPLLTHQAWQILFVESFRCAFNYVEKAGPPPAGFYSCSHLDGEPFEIVRRKLGALLEKKLGADAFEKVPLEFNSQNVRIYPSGSVGKRPHRDKTCFINLIVIVILEPGGEFFVCEDNDGAGRRVIPAEFGDAILLRAPGLRGDGVDSPLHGRDNITQPCRVYMLRQKVRA